MIKKKKGRKIAAAVMGLILIVMLSAFFYVKDYYHSDERVKKYLQGNEQVAVSEIADGLFVDGPGEEAAVVFYPGAKVEYTAYLPLFYGLAEQGVDCLLIKMPCNLAILGQNKAGDIMETYEYKHWYLAGHSLGGAMAASYAAGHAESFDGLILLAAYPTRDLKGEQLSVLSVYGSEDGVLNMEKLEEGRLLMPAGYTELCMEGGNHAGFGNYGKQKGDGEAKISSEKQQKQTIEAVMQMIDGNKETKQEEVNMAYQQITAQEAKKIMDEEADICILDVRTQEEYDSGHIKESICLPNEEIVEEPEELPDKKQKILVYCRSGNRSKQAAQKLADMGYENVLEFGGILDWPYQEMVE